MNPFYSLITPSPESFDGGVESGNVQSFTVGPRETLTWHAIVGRPDGPALPQQVRDFTGARGPIPPPLVGRPEITSCVPRLSQALPE